MNKEDDHSSHSSKVIDAQAAKLKLVVRKYFWYTIIDILLSKYGEFTESDRVGVEATIVKYQLMVDAHAWKWISTIFWNVIFNLKGCHNLDIRSYLLF